ncbi:MAG: hypothetical protein KDB02_04540 [Acidimicrobiales bacterium]|nr:hypothetical protein [Acidimicrobiales bacterium]
MPSSRAAAGGLLVAVAAIGTWAAASGGNDAPRTKYLVARHAVAAGVALQESDLTLVAVDLPDRLRSSAFDDVDELVGAVTRGPLAAGDLVQSGSVSAGGAPVGQTELSFSVDPRWAVGGEIAVGDRITVYTTDDDGVTRRVLTGVDVLRVTSPDDDGLAADGTQTVVVSAAGADVARAVAATRTADITVVRVNGPQPGDEVDEPSVAPPSSEPETESAGTTTRGRRGGKETGR